MASGDFTKGDEGYFVFAVAAGEIVFVEADGGDGGGGVGKTDEPVVIGRIFGFVDEVRGKEVAFVIGNFGGGIFAEGVADGVDVFGGGFKVFIGGDAGVFEFDAGVFEAVVETDLAAGSEDDAVGANHFFATAINKNDMLAVIVFAEGYDFGTR